jgi:nuclear cap-binding protein subunit 1
MSDLVNCHVVSAGSLLQLLDNFVDAALEEGVPQVFEFLVHAIVINQMFFFLTFKYNRLDL